MHQSKLLLSQLMAYLPLNILYRCVATHRSEHKVKVEHVSVDAADPSTSDGGFSTKAGGRTVPLVYKALVAPKTMNLGSADAPLVLCRHADPG